MAIERPTDVSLEQWWGCFSQNWGSLLCKQGSAHPAKFNYGVITRIFDQLRDDRVLKPGSVVFDPFGGVGTGGVVAATRGYKWIGIEVEPRFAEIAEKNFDVHRRKWKADRKPIPEIFQGDSRNVIPVADVDMAVGGPPEWPHVDDGRKEGSGAHGEKNRQGRDKASSDQGNGFARGQLAPNKADAVATSPPYTNIALAQCTPQAAERMRKAGYSEAEIRHHQSNAMRWEYHGDDPHAGRQLASEGLDAFWSGSQQIVSNCFRLLRPRGVAVWVTRNFVRDKKVVDFSLDWYNLCLSCGFRPLRWVLAMNSETWKEETIYGEVSKSRDWKSFFRRFAETNGAERVDWDDVVFMEKP